MDQQLIDEFIRTIHENPVTWLLEFQIMCLLVCNVVIFVKISNTRMNIRHIDYRKEAIRNQLKEELEEEKRLAEEKERLKDEQRKIETELKERKRSRWKRK